MVMGIVSELLQKAVNVVKLLRECESSTLSVSS